MFFSSSLKQVFQRVLRAYAAKLVARLPRGQPGLVTGTEGQVKVCTKYQLDPEIAIRFTYLQEIVNQTFMQQKRNSHVEQDGVKMALGYFGGDHPFFACEMPSYLRFLTYIWFLCTMILGVGQR
jgi:hypothetical protein